MNFRPKKIYGTAKREVCPFCQNIATTKNKQGIPTCQSDKEKSLDNLKCACGEYLYVMEGKFGSYFNCPRCGNINFNKGLNMNGLL
ncbi:hypothetical protein KY334_07545 [Candidatus Woesearchaeota archaeon]|nr:hypothetical protein [Candidatus Woesearchaeota archaeon]